jgi:hypothetical protein
MCFHHPQIFPRVLTAELVRIDVLETLSIWIPPFVTGSLNHIPLWFDREFEYYDIYDVRVGGIHRYYDHFYDIVWDVTLVITLVCGRYFILRMPMLNNVIRQWNNINFLDVYRNIQMYGADIPIPDAIYHQGHPCNMFMCIDNCDTLIISRRALDDSLLVEDGEDLHSQFRSQVAFT